MFASESVVLALVLHSTLHQACRCVNTRSLIDLVAGRIKCGSQLGRDTCALPKRIAMQMSPTIQDAGYLGRSLIESLYRGNI